MSRFTRRHLLKTGLAVSAGAVAPKSNFLAAAVSPGTSEPASAGIVPAESASSQLRERLLLDFGWRFHFGHASDPSRDFGFGSFTREGTFAKSGSILPIGGPEFDDSGWQSLDLPHDWAVDLPFKNFPKLPERGAKPLGREFPETSIGWYRRVFTLPAADASRRISVEFDGMFREAMVIINGHYLGTNMSGYAPARFDITDFVNFGAKNALAVRVDATLSEGWFYEGAGIYRHVWLTKTGPVHVAHWGTYVRAEVKAGSAQVYVQTEIENESNQARSCRVVSKIVNSRGETVAEARTEPERVPAWGAATVHAEASVPNPLLWSVDVPNLYKLVSTLESDGVAVDQCETTFGIRSIEFDADKGFLLNGKHVLVKGTCNHQDHAGVGSALPDRLQSYRVERLKAFESNAYRTSHNPPTPELLDACDRLGMLVMDETRMMDSTREGLSQLERLVRRDRNHPSVVIWSIGNEEPEQGNSRGERIAATMKQLIRKLDPSRPITEAMNYGWGKGLTDVVDVMGLNYAGGREQKLAEAIDDFRSKFPGKPVIGSETGSTVSTRGIYENDKVKGYVSAYDINHPPWAHTAEHWWSVYDARPYLAGGFAWTGFDYRGEPTPYSWPCISSHFGILDTCGFAKDNFFYYQAWWGARPVLHLFPHWNWSGKEGQELDVWCHCNLESVELFLNGKSLGSRPVKRNSHVEWKVKYEPGVIEARASKDGKVVLTDKRETTGAPARLRLTADRQKIPADGEDVSVVTVEVLDSKGRVVPVAMNEVGFKMTGPGRILGVGNGDPSCHESDRPISPSEAKRSSFNGLCCVIVQALKQPGEIRLEASAAGLESASVEIHGEAATPRPTAD